MKWVTYLSQGNAQPRCVVVQGESMCGAKPELSIIDALGLGADGMSQLEGRRSVTEPGLVRAARLLLHQPSRCARPR